MVVTSLLPVALGFFGLGTGYLIFGPYELLGFPKEKSEALNRSLGQWGIWMPGFLQFVTGILLWLGITLFPNAYSGDGYSIAYMAALAFTAYGVHWFALGYNKYTGADARVDGYMAFAFLWISITGAVAFFNAGDNPVGILFALLALVYISDIPASLFSSGFWTKIKGVFHIVTGVWLMYLMFSAVMNFALNIHTWI